MTTVFYLLLFFSEGQLIAQHAINEVCFERCAETRGTLSYTTKKCFLKIQDTTFVYDVVRWVPEEGLLQVANKHLTAYFLINYQDATMLVVPHDKSRYKGATIKLHFRETIYYEY
jgi:hypothetical protein